jgi:hypothetical protein
MPAAASAARAWRKLSKITGSFQSISENLLSYTKQLLEHSGRKPQADDLRWTGMSRRQASAALRVMKAEAFVRSRPISINLQRRFLKKAGTKWAGKAKSKKEVRASSPRGRRQKLLARKQEGVQGPSHSGEESSAASP